MKKMFFLICVIFLLPGKIFSWGVTGHRIIAQLAEENVKKKTKKEIERLLNGYPMAYWADWADCIRSDTTGRWEHTYGWHYVNAPAGLSQEAFLAYVQSISVENIYSEIPKLEAIAANRNLPEEERIIALRFIIHFLGDIHQPMHAGRQEDLGGNKIKVSWFYANQNIHSVWDSKLIEFEKYSYTEYSSILNILTKKQKNKLREGTLEDWLYETYILAEEIYASVKDGDNLSYEYPYKYKPVMELQLQRAGLRLAEILDRIFR